MPRLISVYLRTKLKTKEVRAAVAISAVLTTLTGLVYLAQWEEIESLSVFPWTALCIIAVLSIFFVGLTCGLLALFSRLGENHAKSPIKEGAQTLGRLYEGLFAWRLGSVCILSASILLLWLPGLVAAYPCFMDWDTLNQLFQYTTDAPVNYGARAVDVMVDAKYIDHDTLISTLIFGFCWSAGSALGSQEAGLFGYIALQSIVAAFALATMCAYINKSGGSHWGVIACAIFCIGMPVFSRFAATMLKDSLFSPFFLLFFVCYVDVFRSNGDLLLRKGHLLIFAICSVLCVETKKTGGCIVLISLLVLLVAFRVRWKSVVLGLIGPVLLCLFAVQGVLYPALDVKSVGQQEILSVPFQQTAAVISTFPEDVDAGEMETIGRVLDPEAIAACFNPALADPVKNTFKQDASLEDLCAYARVYFFQGIRHPILYLETVFRMNGALYVPINTISLPMLTCESEIENMARFEGDSPIMFSRPTWADDSSSFLNHVMFWTLNLLGILGTGGLYGGWIPLFTLLIMFFCQRGKTWMLMPVILSMCILLASPTAAARYDLPLIYCAPLLLSISFAAVKDGFGSGSALCTIS